MTRTCNLKDIEAFRRSYSNALFNTHYLSFDRIFRLVDISSFADLFVDERIDETVTSPQFFERFKMSPHIRTQHDLEQFIENRKGVSTLGSMYFIFGKKGAGKSTLLRHFVRDHLNDDLSTVLFLDLYGLTETAENIETYIWHKIYLGFKRQAETKRYFEETESAREVRPLFKDTTREKIVDYLITDRHAYVQEFFDFISKRRRVYVMIDNTDELGSKVVKQLVQVGYTLAREYPVRVIFALRDYWTGRELGLGRQFQFLSTYLQPPKIEKVISKRIENLKFDDRGPFIIEYTRYDPDQRKRITDARSVSLQDVKKFLKAFVEEALEVSPDITKDLYQLCNYDVREVLDNIYNFFHSCKLPMAPMFQRIILKVDRKGPQVRLSDFITCFFTIHSVCYDYKSSRLFNIFDLKGVCEASNYRNTLGLVRILQRCSIGQGQNKDAVVKDFERLGYSSEVIYAAMSDLIDEGMLESPDGTEPAFIQTLKVTQKGHFYIDRLIYMFDYLQYVQDRVPMEDKYHVAIQSRFGHPFSKVVGLGDWEKRTQSVFNFLDFLAIEETNEASEYQKQPELLERVRGGDPTPLSRKMRKRIEEEIRDIALRYYHGHPGKGIEFVEIVAKFPKKEPAMDHGSMPRKYHDEVLSSEN